MTATPDEKTEDSKVESSFAIALKAVIGVVAVASVLFLLGNVYRPRLSPVEAANIHLGSALILIFLWEMRRARSIMQRLLLLALIVISIATTSYIGVLFEELIQRIGIAQPLDTAVGVTLLLVTFEASRRAFGIAIPLVAMLMMGYAYFGPSMPGFLYHPGFGFARLIGNLTTYQTGLYSSLLFQSTTIISIFMIFGGFLASTGATNFFVTFALRIGQGLRSGPAMAAVAASAFFGSVNGSPVANASTTGIFTIPLMRRHGYSGPFAAATEAVASTGGTLLPPIMGVSAFLMASITGIPYLTIAGHALIPAILFFAGVVFMVHLRSKKLGLEPQLIVASNRPPYVTVLEALTFFGPITVIVVLMLRYMPASYSALSGLLALVGFVLLRDGVFLLTGWKGSSSEERPSETIVPEDRRRSTAHQIFDGCLQGAIGAARIGVVVATLGVIVHAFTMTGLAGRVVHILSGLSGEDTFSALVIVAGVSMLFGLGVPSAGSYVIVAILGAPILVNLDIPVVAAHLFILYFTMLSGLTPPVGATAMVTAQIAETSYLRTAVQALGLALPGFVVPFFSVYQPGILGIGETPVIIGSTICMVLAVYAISAALEGQHLAPLNLAGRVVFAAAAMLFVMAGIINFWLGGLGAALLIGITVTQVISRGGGNVNIPATNELPRPGL